MSRFVIKICGITSSNDGQHAVDAGAMALGFNFYPQSPRYVTRQQAESLIERIKGEYLRVGVFVNASHEELSAAANAGILDVLQLHGSVPDSLPQNVRLWRAVPADSLPQPDPVFEAYLLDTPSSSFGGSGKAFDWSLAAKFQAPFLVAGGLHPSNVADAIAATCPAGVDACSRLELIPGQKDATLVRAFVRAASEAHRQLLANEMIVTA